MSVVLFCVFDDNNPIFSSQDSFLSLHQSRHHFFSNFSRTKKKEKRKV